MNGPPTVKELELRLAADLQRLVVAAGLGLLLRGMEIRNMMGISTFIFLFIPSLTVFDSPDGGTNPGNNLHVSGLSSRIDSRELEAIFSKIGKVSPIAEAGPLSDMVLG